MPTLTSLSDLVDAYGRDVRFWAGAVWALGLKTSRGPNNSICLAPKERARIDALHDKRPVAARVT